MPCCKRAEVRRVCHPLPSLLSRFNCTPCNRVLFFVIGVGIGVFFVNNKNSKKDSKGDSKKKGSKDKK
ncbi:uncharacterized protein Dana_GF19792 [Drosophila ananassae]|uniref:Uncharacterized protein n=1 Tax=Drosophila ananassae TaxID=7217 RepID=B3MBS8_DROAN|nr:uncharacterized protein LOC123256969 [Drosophila ananassae]EDV36099.1 uncharacterized protein Dana_GF19792 [Drosophila ananassae]